ncbi:MAG: phosphoribosylamine--glycine ligase [Bdellovibrionaceae bacterium]|nr:phosphoribosylamine--glycine ligase [Pseudobdellovibrionaceae bacterium]|tara:strand:- start:305 stop:1564 length:1260 start_codon:yes stop_codon:yes gene_type:complete
MRVVVFGTGGREHALVKALSASMTVSEVHAVPGSDGISKLALCHNVDPTDFASLGSLMDRISFDLAIIGPEAYLDKGLADFLRDRSIPVVGPNQVGARLESSKLFAKQFMVENGVPTARFFEVSSVEETVEKARNFSAPYVLKVDGLAAGKGVFICKTFEELQSKADLIFNQKAFGGAGKTALLEEHQTGFELSCLVLTNGEQFEVLPLMQDHKRLLEGDEGPNTGGMGVVGPLPESATLIESLKESVIGPTVKGLARSGMDFKGVVFIGLMMTENGPSVLEYNVRFGDPEAQALLPLYAGDWGEVFLSLAKGSVKPMSWKPLSSACVVLAAPGYPDQPEKGLRIEGELDFESPSSYFLHAGTRYADKMWQTNGGRVLNSIGLGSTLEEALQRAYAQAEKIKFQGMQMRRDLGQGLLKK